MEHRLQRRINDALRTIKNKIRANEYYFWHRSETKESLSKLGYTRLNALDVILKLTVLDYDIGPEQSHDNQGKIWVFKKDITSNREKGPSRLPVYIKIEIMDAHDEPIIIQSFKQQKNK